MKHPQSHGLKQAWDHGISRLYPWLVKPAYRICLWLLVSQWTVGLSAQDQLRDALYIKAAYRPGYVLPEYSLFNYLLDDYVRSFTCRVSRQTSGHDYWAQLYHYPEYGLTLQYTTLGNHNIFGEEWSVFPFVGIPIVDQGALTLWNQLGLGLGYANKKWDASANPDNVAIGSHLNIHFNFELNLQYQWTKRYALFSGVCFDHLSNGNLGEPNLGINSMTFNMGLRYQAKPPSSRKVFDMEKHVAGDQVNLILAGGVKHARSLQSRSYLVSALSVEYKRKLWRTFYPGIGVDIFYDGATKEEVRAFGEAPYEKMDDYKTGIHLTQELVYHKFSIALQEGFYVLLKDKAFRNKTYHRFILRHQIGDRFFAQIAMKAHVVVLDYLEFGAGYRIKS